MTIAATQAVTLTVSIFLSAAGHSPMNAPDDFPRFVVPGCEKEMTTLRGLFWLHYPGSGPKATLWDEWLTSASLWPAVDTKGLSEHMRKSWRHVLDSRVIDREGYVATHQHQSIAHQLGWPFPFWSQGDKGCGWHFSFKDTAGAGWRPKNLSRREGWELSGAKDKGIDESGWNIDVTEPWACMAPPPQGIDAFQAPFIQIRWLPNGIQAARPCIEWTTDEKPDFGPDRRMYVDMAENVSPTGVPVRLSFGGFGFEADKKAPMIYTMIPLYKHNEWKGTVRRVRFCLGNPKPGGSICLQALFTQFDTRHNINNQNFVRGCAKYFWWTGDLDFLRLSINRMRTAIRYLMNEHHALDEKVVLTTWVGHDGRSGLKIHPDGRKEVLCGRGIGNNYWDLLPFGHKDAYATIQYYDALGAMARIERAVLDHPEWNVPGGALVLDPEFLLSHASEVKAEGNRLFWNEKTGRFSAGVDCEGNKADYGFTFLNLEAIYYDFARPEHARSIMSWLNGDRIVDGDTACGKDIYHWRFGPRATTKRNVEYYFWAWSAPERIPWGAQVQDGGAVLGFSYHDLMARIKVLGPDNARERLGEIIRWFDEVCKAGSYRDYYDGKRDGSLQGGGTPGGLGMDAEFFESVLVPQVVLYGFLGFQPAADGFRISPSLPKAWPELSIDRLRFRETIIGVKATRTEIRIDRMGRAAGSAPAEAAEPYFISLPDGDWRCCVAAADGELREAALQRRRRDGAFEVNLAEFTVVVFKKR